MNASKILFDKLTLEYIQNEMIGKEFENDHLECKLKSRPERAETDKDDELNYAKTLSGFANASGGVLIFGVKAKKENDIDVITDIIPITDVRKFESRLRELESRIIERPIVGIEYHSIFSSGQDGLVAVYIPQSLWPPHRSLKDSKFYIRAGGSFHSLDLVLIEDLFFRRRFKPRLDLDIFVRDAGYILVSVKNDGEASAKNLYVVIKYTPGLVALTHELGGSKELSSFVYLREYKGDQGQFVATLRGDLVVHPDSQVPIFQFRSSSKQEEQRRIDYYIHADDVLPFYGHREFMV